jgi:hypothetical protein
MELILDSELENVSGGNAVVAAVVGAIGTVVGAVICQVPDD